MDPHQVTATGFICTRSMRLQTCVSFFSKRDLAVPIFTSGGNLEEARRGFLESFPQHEVREGEGGNANVIYQVGRNQVGRSLKVYCPLEGRRGRCFFVSEAANPRLLSPWLSRKGKNKDGGLGGVLFF